MKRAVIVGLTVLLGLTGCVGVPDSGAVHQGNQVTSEESINLDVIPQGPASDATQEQILRGFIDAAASPGNNYETARSFLTPDFESQWNPDAGVVVDTVAQRTFTPIDQSSISVTVAPVASVSDSGVLGAPPQLSPLSYGFQQVAGQWRISAAPTGLLMDDVIFGTVFSKYPLYFFDPSYRYLVPDMRWFPRRESTQTSIVRELLRGASEWLAPGVVSALPSGTTLVPDSVPITSRVASMNFNTNAPSEQTNVERITVQVEQSLSAVAGINSVNVSMNGVERPAVVSIETPVKTPKVDPRSLVLRGGEFGFLSNAGQIAPLGNISAVVSSLNPTAVTMASSQRSAAVLASDGVWLVHDGDSPSRLDDRSALIAPTVDGFGVLWSLSNLAPTQLNWYAAGGAGGLAAPWPADASITAMKVSRDNTRLIVLATTGGKARLFALAIGRGDAGRPTTLGPLLEVATFDGTPRDVAWLDPSNVVALITTPAGDTTAAVRELGGRGSGRQAAPDGVAIAGGNALRDARVLTAAGELETQNGAGWKVGASGISVLATQQ